MIAQAVEAELQQLLAQHQNVMVDGKQAIVRNGFLPERTLQTGVGDVEVQIPKVRDRSGHGVKFNSNLIPPYLKRTKSVAALLLSLIMQENTQSNIIRKLNSHARYARLKAALFEYNAIFKSTHILNLIDNMELRKAIRSARNRTEAYHQLQSNIRKTYNGVFQDKRIVENRVSAHAARLVANCIVAYNSMILNAVYQKMQTNGASQKVLDEFTRISPIAWTHALFTGRYSFKKSGGKIDVEAMARILEEHMKQHFWRDN
ncbi:hypothetical protein CGH51_21500 [Vibrio parahaemolyticus]|nr:hypothetical protein CGH51_21500 [Vibrio parahaemolyticus]